MLEMQNFTITIIGGLIAAAFGLYLYLSSSIRRLNLEVTSLKLMLEAETARRLIAEECQVEPAPVFEYRGEFTDTLIDSFSGLPNERSLHQFFVAEANRAKRHKYKLMVLSIEIKNLDLIGENYGYFACDQFLQEAAEALRSCLRAYDFLARCSANKFVAILPETANEDISGLVLRLRDSVERLIYRRFTKLTNEESVYIGSAEFGQDGEGLEELLFVAELAAQSCSDAIPVTGVVDIRDYQSSLHS
ncbi:MAG TPA: GGDEF domain-containing protein [Blastocatellia bacterium]|nr:GGDEF domain-containing protein [Blastocatellia bacterium]